MANGHGGRRAGAGRPPGSKNKRTRWAPGMKYKGEEFADPVDFMMSVMRNPHEDMDRRLECARAAAPYVHPKLAAKKTVDAESDQLQIFEWND